MSVGPCENYPSQVVWVLRKHIHSSNKHKNWLSASIVRFFPPYWIPTLRRCCHAWLQNIHVRHFNPYRIQRVCSQSRRKQTADPLSTRHPNLLQILAHYASFVAGSPSTKQSQQLPIIGLCECIIIFFNLSPPTSPVIIWREQSQRVTKPEENPQNHTVTAKKRKVLTCVLRQSLRYYSPDLGRFVNIPV